MTPGARRWRRARAVVALILLPLSLLALHTAWPRGHGDVELPVGGQWSGPMGPFTAAGVVHVHTAEHSQDARAPRAALVAAARDNHLAFLVLADHEAPQPLGPGVRARFEDGVLLVAGSEWSADDAHVFDLSPTPGRAGYAAVKDALPDCLARGGPCVAAHPTAWRRPWRPALTGVHGVEIHSSMTGLGDRVRPPFVSLVATAWTVLLNPGYGLWLEGAFDPAAVTLWEAYAPLQPLAAYCGADVHGLLPIRENMLAYTTLLALDAPLSSDAAVAHHQVLRALGNAVCTNMLAGRVDGLTVSHAASTVDAYARLTGALGPASLVLFHHGEERARVLFVDGEARATAPRVAGPWRAVVEVETPGAWGRVNNSAAIRLHLVPVDGGG